MRLRWKEVSPFTGIEEDAPVNSIAGGGVDMPPDMLHQKKKKKKELMTRHGQRIDGRTKSYREHRKNLESAREKRSQSRTNSRFIEAIKNRIINVKGP